MCRALCSHMCIIFLYLYSIFREICWPQQETFQFTDYSGLYGKVVPQKHLLRQINDLVDFSFVYKELVSSICTATSTGFVGSVTISLHFFKQEFGRESLFALRHFFWCTGRKHLTAFSSALRPHVDDVVRLADDVEVVLYDDNGISTIYQLL